MNTFGAQDPEAQRLAEDARRELNWKRWGPYLSDRQWGTVREDYSANGDAWNSFPHDHARSRAYRWGEDGLLGITDRECRLCFALALWNGKDPILKERLFGLTGPEGNHGEDCKECYYYLDSTPTHSYLKALYKYPQAAYPYNQLVEENRRRGKLDPEFELEHSGVFDGGRYFDVFAEYAKAGPDDMLIQLSIHNRGPAAAPLHVLPTFWFRNTWSWGCLHEGCWIKPRMLQREPGRVEADHVSLGRFAISAAAGPDGEIPEFIFTENETNVPKLFQHDAGGRYFKDAFHAYVIHGRADAVNPRRTGTKAAAVYKFSVPAQGRVTLRLRLTEQSASTREPFSGAFSSCFEQRRQEADRFFAQQLDAPAQSEEACVHRQALAGLLWSKQYYHYVVKDWLEGDPEQPPPPPGRQQARNSDWGHLFNRDVISMPDKWEYPWFAAWDLAFHMIPLAQVDPDFAKQQLLLFLREWYMHPNGQIPAYEWNFSDVNPPVHAWACWRVYKMSAPRGQRDRQFLARAFHKLLINFTWWVNRKDVNGKHLFSGGFLGLDNIGLFDRSKPLPGGSHLEQADGTAWMAFYAATMLAMALELAGEDPSYEDVASKFFEHFVAIADAMNSLGGSGLWHAGDGFYYDQLHLGGTQQHLRIRSMVGLIPLFAVEVLEDETLEKLPGFRKRMQWFLDNRKDLAKQISYMTCRGTNAHNHYLLAIPSRERLEQVLKVLLDEREFLSPHGIRSLSACHRDKPFVMHFGGEEHCVKYVPGESDLGLFGGNSNWRGPIWFPVNYLLIEALERYGHFYGDSLRVECPTGSGRMLNLEQVAKYLAQRMNNVFMPDARGRRPVHGGDERYAGDPHWKDLVLFYEYFHGDDGRGIGASHQTGWTALAAKLLRDHTRRQACANGQPRHTPAHTHEGT